MPDWLAYALVGLVGLNILLYCYNKVNEILRLRKIEQDIKNNKNKWR